MNRCMNLRASPVNLCEPKSRTLAKQQTRVKISGVSMVKTHRFSGEDVIVQFSTCGSDLVDGRIIP